MTDGIRIRAASPEDAPALLRIYAPYVKNTAITYEYDVPSVDEFSKRIETTLKRFPYLVLERGGEIIATPMRVRSIRAPHTTGRSRLPSISPRMSAAADSADSSTTRSKTCCASRAFST